LSLLLASSFFNLHIFVFGVILMNKISIGYAINSIDHFRGMSNSRKPTEPTEPSKLAVISKK